MVPLDPEATDDLPGARISVLPSASDGSAPYLVVCVGATRVAQSIPRAGSLVVGRGSTASLRLEDRALSREHFSITWDHEGVWLRDLGSQHGTAVDGVRVAEPVRLRGDQVIRAGHTTSSFQQPGAPARSPDFVVAGVPVWSGDPAMAPVIRQLQRLAAAELPVLVLGETGTGKEVAARALHAWSSRASGPFVAINCAALPEALVEAELFGHERGAFSSASVARPGLFEVASGGTLFLDEVGELAPGSQAKLLRALETRRVQRLGDAGAEREVDVRVVSATNASLASSPTFRRDLFFRLGGATVAMPPLRERPIDVIALARAFLGESCARSGRPLLELGVDAVTMLLAHPWPGNVRELRHLIDHAVASEPGSALSPRWLRGQLQRAPTARPTRSAPTPVPGPPSSFRPIEDEVRELERSRMAQALRATRGNRTRAAELISMPRRTFLTKLKQYALDG